MKKIEAFRAFDDSLFETENACRAYEREHAAERLVGLTAAQIDSAITREDTDLADALEEVGKLCETRRLAAGDRRRKPKGSKTDGETNGQGADAAQPEPEVPPSSGSEGLPL